MKRIREDENAPARARKAGHSIPARDHLGRAYPSRKAMCETWGISPPVYFNRRRRGWAVEEALTGQGPAKPLPRIIKDHTGRRFPTIAAMCEAWGVSPATYGHRRTHGMSVETALTSPVPSRAARDHTGREFPSVSAMCRAWRVDDATYRGRRKRGMDVEAALTATEAPHPRARPVTDHTGRDFPTVRAMCRAWGVPVSKYYGRRKQGMDIREALTGPERD